jgi:hypothetical protein
MSSSDTGSQGSTVPACGGAGLPESRWRIAGDRTLFIVRNSYEVWAEPSDKEYQIYSATKSFTSTVRGCSSTMEKRRADRQELNRPWRALQASPSATSYDDFRLRFRRRQL